ncbi:MAG: hypothetical protein AAF215_19040 [Cyanobacteria bacterium P01_A01_bin.123]
MLGFLLAVCLALLHLFVGKLSGFKYVSHRRWISLAGGVSIAYIFLDVFPELAHAQEEIEHSEISILAYLEQHVYLLALLGLVLFYGLDKLALRSRTHNQKMSQVDATGVGVFWVHIAAFAIYNAILGYLFRESADHGLVACLLLFITLGLHFLVNDLGMREHHKHSYDRLGRWILAAAIIAGWAVAQAVIFNPAAIAVIWAIVAGGIILNVLKEELPEQRESDFITFLTGALGYGALLLIV